MKKLEDIIDGNKMKKKMKKKKIINDLSIIFSKYNKYIINKFFIIIYNIKIQNFYFFYPHTL